MLILTQSDCYELTPRDIKILSEVYEKELRFGKYSKDLNNLNILNELGVKNVKVWKAGIYLFGEVKPSIYKRFGRSIVRRRIFDLEEGDGLEWNLVIKNNEFVIEVKPIKKEEK